MPAETASRFDFTEFNKKNGEAQIAELGKRGMYDNNPYLTAPVAEQKSTRATTFSPSAMTVAEQDAQKLERLYAEYKSRQENA